MASIITSQHGNSYCPQAKFEVTESSSTGGAVTYAWTLKWVTHGYTVSSSASKAYTAKIDGATVTSGSFAIGGKTSQTIASGTYTINKGTSSRSVAIYLSFAMTFTWSGTSGSTKTASGSFTLPAKTSYTVSYNVNGGSGSFANQTKWWGTNLTLHSGSPSRTGHNFVRWNTNTSNTGTGYAPGATYSSNAALALYAIWSAHTYTVSYNANGGSGAPGNQTKTYGQNLTLSSTKPTRTNYNFLGWSTSASGSVVYAAGATYTANSAVTLYAVWQLAYKKPRITNFSATRCTSNGTVSETGTYIKLNFSWATDKTVTSIYVQYKLQSASSWTSGLLTYSGTTSGTVTQAVGQGNISTESSYHVRVYVTDSGGTTYSSTLSIGTVKFPIDVKAGGKGVAIGKVAEKDAFEVGMYSYFNDQTTMSKSSGDVFHEVKRSDTGVQVAFGVGAGGENHGMYSRKLDRWIIYANASRAYLNKINIMGTAADKPLRVRGIVGSDGDYTDAELYLQYQANKAIHLGNAGSYTISADGSYYSGNCNYANSAGYAQKKVGEVIITGSNSNPNNLGYSGTWSLIDKEFASADNVSAWSHNTTNVSSSDHDFTRAGHSLFLSGGFTTANKWEDSDIHLGTVNFSSLGVSRIGSDCYFVAYTDDGNSGLMCEIEYDTGKLIVHDNFGDSYIAAGRNGKWSCNITVPMVYMNDGACSKFYWKRTA